MNIRWMGFRLVKLGVGLFPFLLGDMKGENKLANEYLSSQ
jgi:hypothetical protein